MKTEQELSDFKMRLLQAEIEMNGMVAENKVRESNGKVPAYWKDDFMELIEKYEIYHNDLWR